jgi:glycine hydroxymethyltransferase
MFAEMIEFGREYADQIIRSSKALAQALHERGFDVICEKKGITESHMVVVNVSKIGGSHKVGEILDRANIVATKSGIPGVDETLYSGPISGIRLGTQEAVRLGMGPSEMDEAADFLARVLIKKEDPARVAQEIAQFRRDYQKIHYCFDEGADAYKYCSAR